MNHSDTHLGTGGTMNNNFNSNNNNNNNSNSNHLQQQQQQPQQDPSLQQQPQQQQEDEATAEAKRKRAGPKRRKVTHGRPCQRCIKRNIGHLCHDEPKPSQLASAAAAANSSGSERGNSQQQQAQKNDINQQQPQQNQTGPPHLQSGSHMGGLPMYGYNNQLSTLPVTPLTFASEHMGNEFTVISDFLESLGGEQPNMFSEQGMPVNVNTTEKFFLTAADPSDGTNEDRLTQVINAKFEAGFLKPYNYVNGYSRLQKYMDTNMSNISRQRILNVMGTFRPAFRSVAQSLTDIDLVLVEEAFERLLLDYDRVFSSMGIPACLWRRTGEIYKGNKEFAALVNVPLEMLREGRLCIYELMAEESAVNYWEKYGNIAFDAGQKAVLTSCLLKNPDPDNQTMLSSTSSIVQLAKAPFKRAQRGLFGGKQIQFGNNVPFSKTKTRRTWLPNVQTKRLFSETLNDWIRLNMTTSVIRTVDKKGGLDRYLLETRDDLLGAKGIELRGRIVEALKLKQAKRSMAHYMEQQRSTTLSTEANEAVKAVTQKVDPSAPVVNTSASSQPAAL
ncbi:hypothetical protein BGZ90_011269 [Linnemannia elongata]|nr:hypothetical protein BGZ90_011269 [Linnemannia elongata]